MSDITVTFKNQTILTMDASGSKSLLTQGKYCEDDITIAYDRPSGGGGDGYKQYKSGILTPESDYSSTDNKLIVSLADIGFTPRVFILKVVDRDNVSGVQYAVIYAHFNSVGWNYRSTIRYSNTSNTFQSYNNTSSWTDQISGYLYNDGTNIYFRTTNQYILKANVDYGWEAYA